MFASVLLSVATATPNMDITGGGGGPFEIHIQNPIGQPTNPFDIGAMNDVLPLIDILNQPLVKAPSSLTDFDPLMPLMLHLNDPLPDPFAPHNLRGPPDPLLPDLDPFLMEMMGRMNLGLLTPPRKPDECAQDTKKMCSKDQRGKSTLLHCLSDHASELSSQCYNKIKGTLPHVCHKEIEDLCDALEEGVMACMERNIAKLRGTCLDSYVASRHTVDAVKAADKADLVNKLSGEQKPLWKSLQDWQQSLDDSAKSVLARIQLLAGITMPFTTVLIAGVVLLLALYWYVRDGGLRGKRRNVTQGLIKCEELLPHAEKPNYGALTL